MFKSKAWLLMAVMALAITPLAYAQASGRVKVGGSQARARTAPNQRVELGVKPVAPYSTDRKLAPDQYPTNVVKVLRTTNKAQTNFYVPVVFDFKNNNPFNVVRFLRRPVQLEEGELFTFVNDKGDGGKVLFIVPDYMVSSLTELVSIVDRPELTSSGGDKYVYAQLKHRRADTSDPDFLAAAASFSTGNGATFLTDPEENALFLKDAPSGGETFEQALKEWLDVPTAMLELGVKVYEIDATNDAQIGLDYMAWKNGPGASLFAVGAFAEHGSFGRQERVVFDPIGTGARGLPHDNFSAKGYNYAFRYDVPSQFFDFLAVKGKARVLNEMKLSALNTRAAVMTAGEQILFYDVNTSNPSGIRDSGEPLQANVGRTVVGTTHNRTLVPVETGVKLSFTPLIGEKTVRLEMALEWSDYASMDDTGFPQINKRTLDSTLRCQLGEEIIVGGLDRQAVVKATRKVPILGSLPLIGYAFGGETSQTRKSELVVVITPSAVMRYNLTRDKDGNLVPSTNPADRDYRVTPGEQRIVDRAKGTTPITEPKAEWGFEQIGLDQEYGVKAGNLK